MKSALEHLIVGFVIDNDGIVPVSDPADTEQLALLGLTFVVTCAVFYLALGTVARSMLHHRSAVAER